MRISTQAALWAIAVLLAIIVLKPAAQPMKAYAQVQPSQLYVEPGTTMIRKPDGTGQMEGKLFIDLQTGDCWGFPTYAPFPYPINSTRTEPATSLPIYLGRFDLSKIRTR